MTALAVDGETAYLSIGPRLVVLDLADAGGPQTLFTSDVLPVTATGLALENDRLYWLSSDGQLLVFDISSPPAPKLLADLDISPGGQAIAVRDGRLYMSEISYYGGGAQDALRVYEISAAPRLAELSTLEMPNQPYGLQLVGERAYLTLWDGSFVTVDVSDPAAPHILHVLKGAYGHYVQFPYLFTSFDENLAVFDLSDAGQPQRTAAWPYEQEPRLTSISAGAVYNQYLYLFDISAPPCGGDVSPSCMVSFHVLDISDPADPQSLSGPAENPTFDAVAWAQVQGEQLLVSDRHGLTALSLADPVHPAILWRYPAAPTLMGAYDFTLRNGWLYLGTDLLYHSLYVFDLRHLSQPRLAGPFEPSIATSGLLSGDTLYLALGPDGLSALDVTQPDAPQEIARLNDEIVTQGGDLNRPLAAVGDTLYMSIGWAGLGIVDISDPRSPRTVGAFDTGGTVRDMALGPEYLYVLTPEALNVLDLSTPHTPRIIDRLKLPDAWSLALDGDLAFVASMTCLNADGTGGLAVISLSDPAHPALLSTPKDVPCGLYDVAASGDYVFLAAGSDGILGIDVSDPAAPYLAARFSTPSLATRVAVDGDLIYALDEMAGIYVLHL